MDKSTNVEQNPPMDHNENLEKDEHVHLETLNIPGEATEEVAYTDADAKRVLRKLDLWLMPILMVSYLLQYWDKALSGQAVQFNFGTDLGLIQVIGHDSTGKALTSTTRLANITLIFYVAYLIFAYPAALLSQRFPTAKVCSVAMFLWAIIVLTTPACKTYAGIMVNRFFLGAMESVIAPSFTIYGTFWWTRREQTFRMPLWWGCTGVAAMITPLISWGLGHIHGDFGASTWKYMYLFAGSLTLVWSIVVGIVLPDDPKSAKWINERDRAIVLARIKENNTGIVDRHLKWRQVKEGVLDYNFWQGALIVGSTGIPNTVFSSFSTLVISGFGYSAFNSLLLLIPMGFTVAVTVYACGYLGLRFKNIRYYLIMATSTVSCAGALMSWLGPRDKPSVLYAGIILMTFTVAANAMGLSLATTNCAGHTKKATVAGGTFVGYCLGNILGPVCFQSTPGPVYYGGFIACVVVQATVTAIAIFGRWYLGRENARRDREYGPPGVAHALEDLTDKENMDFRYVL